jgi:ribA/ribD-fused uncharacterized protein
MSQIDSFHGEHYFLSNYSGFPAQFEGRPYPTVEHAFAAAKTLDKDLRQRIAQVSSPGEAKRMGRQLALRPDWEEVKLEIMKRLLQSKFEAPALRQRLLATGDEPLIEGNTWHDMIWGICTCPRHHGQGRNLLGATIQEVRSLLHGVESDEVAW